MLALVSIVLPIVGSVPAPYGAARGALRTREALAAHHESDGLINALAWIDRKLLHARTAPVKATAERATLTEGH